MAKLTPTFGWLDLPEYRGWVPGDPPYGPRTSLLAPGMEGERLLLTGHVLTRSGTPLADVRLDFWQADAAGKYALEQPPKLRGVQHSLADGSFTLETILPGYAGHIRHINFMAAAPLPNRKQPLLLRAAIYLATERELDRPIAAADRDHVRPGARTYRDDPAFLPLRSIPNENGVRHVSYNIVFDVD
jgi:protocatechuate 3,4-dioxygenase beta subunit